MYRSYQSASARDADDATPGERHVQELGVSLFAIMIASSAQAQQIGDVFYIALENHNFTQPCSAPNSR